MLGFLETETTQIANRAALASFVFRQPRLAGVDATHAKPNAESARPRKRSLWPREHGAYGQLGAPLAAALISVRPSTDSTLLRVTPANRSVCAVSNTGTTRDRRPSWTLNRSIAACRRS